MLVQEKQATEKSDRLSDQLEVVPRRDKSPGEFDT